MSKERLKPEGDYLRKDFIIRLIAGVRKQIEKDPREIKIREELGEDGISARWVDAASLCSVIEKDVLGYKN